MRDLLALVTNVIDIWPYVAAIPAKDLAGSILIQGVVESVYRNNKDTFDHVLVLTETKNVYLVLVIDLTSDQIVGHHLLDINFEYGLVAKQ